MNGSGNNDLPMQGTEAEGVAGSEATGLGRQIMGRVEGISNEHARHTVKKERSSSSSSSPPPSSSSPPPPPPPPPHPSLPLLPRPPMPPKSAAAASKRPGKKKGTAAVKAPRSRASGPGGPARRGKSRAGGGPGRGSKKGNAGHGSINGGGDGDGEQPEGDEDEESDSDSGTYCICRKPDDHQFMIACDRCEDWFHGRCIGMDKWTGENLVQKYICPNCSNPDLGYVTRYKKTCALEGCPKPARVYLGDVLTAANTYGNANSANSASQSVFCSAEHCQEWWEKLIETLPPNKTGLMRDELTQEELVGLLDTPAAKGKGTKTTTAGQRPWKLGDKPFDLPADFWKHAKPEDVLTGEERGLLGTSAAERLALGEEIVRCRQMLLLIDMALKRREAAIAAGRGTAKDLCGYDTRLDTVAAPSQFAAFVQTRAGKAIFEAERLDAPGAVGGDEAGEDGSGEGGANAAPADTAVPGAASAGQQDANSNDDPLTAGMCMKKKCKPHMGWSGILAKSVKHRIRELTAEAREKLDAEARVRDSASGRYRRKQREKNHVVVFDMEDEEAAEAKEEVAQPVGDGDVVMGNAV